ncbi:fimbrial assembly protein [Burkholderia ubonensis]|nr:fimbrial assembly protein [Burkholderia ubonensis]
MMGVAIVAMEAAHASTAAPVVANESAPHSGDTPVEFNTSLMVGNSVDASRFMLGNPVLPGTYNVDLYLNDSQVAQEPIRFVAPHPDDNAKPCLTLGLLESIGVDTKGWFAEDKDQQPDPAQCVDLPARVPAATVTYHSDEQRLDISVPQAALRTRVRGEVDPARWHKGEAAGILQYDFNAYHTSSQGYVSDSTYLGITSGINVGDWRFRYRGALNYDARTGTQWQSLDAYVQRDLTRWKAQLTLGDSTTSGNVFDSFGVRGVQITSDDRMLPDAQRGFAPVVHGVAQSNAKVEVRQNGYVIYQMTVAPGPFEIRDLNPTGYGGDLQVTVTEADGSKQSFSVPYASIPQLLRPGVSRISVAAGQYRTSGGRDHYQPYVAQAIYERGITNLVTGYGGVIGSEGYGAALLGTAFNTAWGALALDVTQAHTRVGSQSYQGQSWRITFAKYIPQTSTSFTMAAYRYSTAGYFSLGDAVQARGQAEGQNYAVPLFRQRNRAQLNISQRVGDGSLYAMGSLQNYWNRDGNDLQFQVGYSGSAKWGNYSISAQRTRNAYGHQDTRVYASVSIPFGRGGVDRKPMFSNLNMSVATGDGTTSVQTSASGSAGDHNQWAYGVNAGYLAGTSNAATLGGYGTYSGGRGTVNASASAGSNSTHQASLGVSGSVIAHRGGVTLGQSISANAPIGLVEAKGAVGAAVTNSPGVKVDRFGYAVVPFLTPYRVNTVVLDPQGMSEDAELKSTSQEVVPRAGAVVRAQFDTTVGKPLLMRVKQGDGTPVPMGADVVDPTDTRVGVVGQGGTVFVRGVPMEGMLEVRWAAGATGACRFTYQGDDAGRGKASACTILQGTMHVPVKGQPTDAGPQPEDGPVGGHGGDTQ